MADQRSNDNESERTPLLQGSQGEDGGSPEERDAWQRGFLLVTATSIASGVLTLILLVASIIVMSGSPSNYYAPFDLYYYFAPTAGCSIIAILHSIATLLSTKNGIPPTQSLSGILVDIFAGLFFLFQSLYSMQQLLYRHSRCYPYQPDPESRCEAWRRRSEPLFWTYLFVTLIFGIVHAVLLFLRAARYKRSGRVLLVQLVSSDGATVQLSR